MTNDELQKVLDQHQHWINKDCDGWKELRADLHGADLHGADLRKANLRGAGLLSSSKLHTILNFIPLDDTSLSYVKTTCELIHAGFISNAKFSAANSEIKINGVAGKVDIKRTKKQTNQMTI